MRVIKKQLAVMGVVLFLLVGGFILLGSGAGNGDEPGTANPNPNEKTAALQSLGKQVYIEAGEYYVGRDGENDNQPPRKLHFKGFYLDLHPVTNKQYLEFLTGSAYKPQGKFDKENAAANPFLPAVEVTFADAEAYAAFYKKRLPTEWEWEIAARSLKQENIYVSGRASSKLGGHFFNDKRYYNLPVFSFPPNELGLYDMAGNVFEWTSSEYEEKYLHGKYVHGWRVMVLRGGAWTNRPFEIRTTTRTPFPARRCLGWVGFRCVSDAK